MKQVWSWLKANLPQPPTQSAKSLEPEAFFQAPFWCQIGPVAAPLPADESERLAALHEYNILDTPPEVAFDDLTHLAAQICQTPIALVSLIDNCRQWFKARVGLAASETHRDLAFCGHALYQPQDVLIVPDALQDSRFATNPLVTSDPHIRFYAGAPLVSPQGYPLGTLCVIDRTPRQLRPDQIEALRMLSRQVVAQLELRRHVAQITTAHNELRSLSQALESAVEGIAQLDSQGRYLQVNRAYAAMLGCQPQDLLGQAWMRTVDPQDRERIQAAYETMLLSGRAEVEVKGLRPDGSSFDKQVVMVKATGQLTEISHYCFIKDISERREIERLKDEFVSVVSHELRTPLTSIRGALGLLASGVLQAQPTKAQRMLEIAVSNTDRLVRLINDILDIERIESGKITMTKQVCDTAQLMSQAVDLMQAMAAQAKITLSLAPLSVQVWADPDRIIQTLTNLLSNAIKFSPPGSTVQLRATQQGDQILFQVQDQGRGIPADKLDTIFGRFQQVDASDSRLKGGTGLGLAICRSIVQHHDGQIWAESSLGAGSTFSFTLPILRSPQPVPNAQRAGTRILVCDDDPEVRTVVQAILEAQGYQATTVASGQEAVAQAVVQQPQLILLNLMMPGMHGWETLAVLKAQPQTKDIPVIILSGLSPNADTPVPPEVTDWIIKPPNEQRLCQALERALVRQRQPLIVLVVEDDSDLAQVLIAVFERHGLRAYPAHTGSEAIRLTQQIQPDLVVLDLVLPEQDGFAVVDWLRQHNRLCQVPLVVYTAQDLNPSDRERLKLGQTLFLTKGRVTPSEFEQRVLELLQRIVQDQAGHRHEPPNSNH